MITNDPWTYRGPRPIWCDRCGGNDSRFVRQLDEDTDLVQCHIALTTGDCRSEPQEDLHRVRTTAAKSDFGYEH